jgi:hypothetical protein
MKQIRIIFKLFACGAFFLMLTAAHPGKSSEATVVLPPTNGVEFSPKILTVGAFVDLSNKEFSELTGNKLSLKEKLALGFIQKKFKSEIRRGNISSDSKVNLNQMMNDEMPKFNIGGFVLGLLLGLIGVGLAHIFSNDKGFRRNSWYGFGAWLIILVIIGLL